MKHPDQWQQIQSAVSQQRMAQSMLFVGPLHCALDNFTIPVIQLLFCKQQSNKPCLVCIDCQMVGRTEHPDVEWLKPEKSGGAIKIDQVRVLQNTVYLTPQRANCRVVVIEAADRMNSAAANAVLKILEEPAKHTVFILLAQQLSTVLPTVLSRCCIIPFSSSERLGANNLLALGTYYPADSARGLVVQQTNLIIEGLIALLEQREHPCILASQWSQFELEALLWFLYLLYAQLQIMYANADIIVEPAVNQLIKLADLLDPVLVFAQLDKINTLIRTINNNATVNRSLALEGLLFSEKLCLI